jgi:two-component system response regulator VicR
VGADDYVTKPFRPRELRARVAALLRHAAAAREVKGVHTAGDLYIDLDRCEVRRGERVLPLTATEFKILRALVACRGAVVADADLIAAVWGPNVHLSAGAIHTHVNNLRMKIERDPARPEIVRTVRGLGHRLDG